MNLDKFMTLNTFLWLNLRLASLIIAYFELIVSVIVMGYTHTNLSLFKWIVAGLLNKNYKIDLIPMDSMH